MDAETAALLEQLLRNDIQIGVADEALRYDGPEEAVTPDLLERLRDRKGDLVAWLTGTDPTGQVEQRGLPAFNQQELWHKDRSAGAPVVYTVAQRWRLSGPLNVAALRLAVNWWLAAFPTLRSRFNSVAVSSGGYQPILETVAAWDQALAVTPVADAVALEDAVWRTVNEPIPLDRAPLWRLELFGLDETEHVLVWMVHHSICDGTSMSRLRDRLVGAYQAFRDGTEPPAVPETISPIDYARSQHRDHEAGRLDQLTDYWLDRLNGVDLDLDFAADRPRPGRLSGRGDILEFALSPEVLARLRDTAKRLDSTLYIVALSAYVTMLAEFTGQNEVVLPISQARRTSRSHAEAVGMLADRVPLRVDVAGAEDFGALVRQVGHRVFEAMDHQGLPLSLLIPRLPTRQRPVGAFPTALFTLLDGFEANPTDRELSIRITPEAPVGTARMEFYCFMSTDETGLQGWLEYSTDRFDRPTVQAWVDRFTEILAAEA